jgi:anti-sigma regulatory factor (Ser/Thr protein kinase)
MTPPAATSGLHHEALLYEGSAQFAERVGSFIREGLASEQAVLVAVGAHKIDRLRADLASEAQAVRFVDMGRIGQNPARIIPAWRAFVSECAQSGVAFRGVGEPIWAGRTADEIVECERHEALLNLAFADGPSWRLACPYDTRQLDPSVIREAHRNHPYVLDGEERESAAFTGTEKAAKPFDRPLPEPTTPLMEMSFEAASLHAVRTFVSDAAVRARLPGDRADDLVLAVDELATNSVRHGGGSGRVRVWQDGDALLCEVRDHGHIEDPLAGRVTPAPEQVGGYGLWLVNQLCDLVQVRSTSSGTTVRLLCRS